MRGCPLGARAVDDATGLAWIVLSRDPLSDSGALIVRRFWLRWEVEFTGIESMRAVATLVNNRGIPDGLVFVTGDAHGTPEVRLTASWPRRGR